MLWSYMLQLIFCSFHIIKFLISKMAKASPVSVFLAASSLLVTAAGMPQALAQEAGGLTEWNTDQGIEEKSTLDDDAAALQKKAEEEDVCVPIGEGENCW